MKKFTAGGDGLPDCRFMACSISLRDEEIDIHYFSFNLDELFLPGS